MTLIGALVVAPFIASFRLRVWTTGAVAAVALAAALALGFANEFFGEGDHLTRVLAVALGGALSLWAARVRTERSRAVRLLELQRKVSAILNEARSLAEAAPRVLAVIGDTLGWPLAAVWEVQADGRAVRLVESWKAPGFEAPGFEEASRGVALERGAGLPGRVWATGAPAAIPSLRDDSDFPRSEAAAAAGLDAGFAFPVRQGETVVGVVEFLDRAHDEPDTDVLQTLTGLGGQIGQYIARTRAEEQRAQLLESERAARLLAERAESENTRTVALLDTLLARAPVGFAFVDTQLRLARVNEALATFAGLTPDELIERPVGEVLPDLPEAIGVLEKVIDTGEPAIEVEHAVSRPGLPGVRRCWLASYYPVRGPGEEPLGVGVVVVEITDRKRAEQRASFLAEATSILNASLEYEGTLASVARLAVPRLADWCVVDIQEPGRGLHRLAIAHSDPTKEGLAWDLHNRYPPDPDLEVGPAHAIRTGESQLIERIDDEMLRASARDDEHLRGLRELGLSSAMVVPLAARGEPFGAVSFASGDPERTFDSQDLTLAEELARRAANAVENARLYQERSYIARTLQQSLLPPELPELPGVELAARYRTAGEATDVGGDFYDVFATGERTWAAVIGDVRGKGPDAAAMIGLARHTVRTAAMRESDPATVLATLNEALYGEGGEDFFCTAVYVTLDLGGGELRVELTAAGHPLPLLLRAEGGVEAAGQPGTLIGAVSDLSLNPVPAALAPGDALVMYTDGVSEARSQKGLFGQEGLEAVLAESPGTTADALAERIESAVVAHQGGEPQDDMAVLVIRRAAPQPVAASPPEPDTLATDA